MANSNRSSQLVRVMSLMITLAVFSAAFCLTIENRLLSVPTVEAAPGIATSGYADSDTVITFSKQNPVADNFARALSSTVYSQADNTSVKDSPRRTAEINFGATNPQQCVIALNGKGDCM